MVALEGGNVGGKGIIREFGTDMYTSLNLKWITNKHLTVQHSKLCSMLCGNLDRKRIWGEWIHVYVWLSPFAVHMKLSQHC